MASKQEIARIDHVKEIEELLDQINSTRVIDPALPRESPINRRAPRAFVVVLFTMLGAESIVWLNGPFHMAHVLVCAMMTGFSLGVLRGAWPRRHQPVSTAKPGQRGAKTAGAVVGYMIMHQMIRRAFHMRHSMTKPF